IAASALGRTDDELARLLGISDWSQALRWFTLCLSRTWLTAMPRMLHAAERRSAITVRALVIRAMTGAHSPRRFWRKMRSFGYHGLSVRPLSQRQQLS